MKKSLILMPLIAALLVTGCTGTKRSNKKKSSGNTPTSGQTTSDGGDPVVVTWPSVADGDGSEANPYSPSQARDEAKKLEQSTTQSTVLGAEVYVRGYVCVIEDIALDRPRKNKPSVIDNDVKFYLADSKVYCDNDQVQTQDAILKDQAFGVYFATWQSPTGKWTDYQQVMNIYGRLVTVKGKLMNWMYCPQLSADSGSHPYVVSVGDKYAGADPNYQSLCSEARSHDADAQ